MEMSLSYLVEVSGMIHEDTSHKILKLRSYLVVVNWRREGQKWLDYK
jgi:hypothetical protein